MDLCNDGTNLTDCAVFSCNTVIIFHDFTVTGVDNNIQLCTFWKRLSVNQLIEVFLVLSNAKTRLRNEMVTVTYKHRC